MTSVYELRVDGHLDAHWSAVLGGLSLRRGADGTSTLTGAVADQAALHGLLSGLRDLGAPLLSVRTLPLVTEPLSRVSWPRRTARLAIRPARPEDAVATWRFRRLEQVSRWLTELPTGLESYRATFEEPERLATTLVVEHDGTVVGDLMLRVEDGWAQKEVVQQARASQAELGWVLDPAFTGRGCGTEAVHELLHIAFDELGLRRVTALCFAENEASWRLMERLGMRRELHAVADALHRSGEWSDTYGYALLAAEWHEAERA